MAIANDSKDIRTIARGDNRGFALLIAIIFMSVMLLFGLALGSLGFKQQQLVSSALGSQYAFYVADAALECALYADQQQNLFAYTPDMSAPAPSMTCDGTAPVSAAVTAHTLSRWVVTQRFSLDGGKRCADVVISKPAAGTDITYLFAQGYDVACAVIAGGSSNRFAARGINARY